MKRLKINFSDFWDKFDPYNNFITDALKEHFEVEISKNPDFVFCSNFGNKHLKYRCVKIYFTGENLVPDFNIVDYGMGFQPIDYSDRYLRLPLYVLYPEACEKALKKHEIEADYDLKSKKFCNFVISNAISDPARDIMIDLLCGYKKVDSGGRYMNNVGGPVKDKIEFEKDYKFSMCFENTSSVGYTSEKIVEGFAGRTVPIYWGDPKVCEEFNPEAFINCNDFDSLEDALEYVKKVDEDDELFLKMLKAPILKEDSKARIYLRENYLSDYLYQILSQDADKAFRRNRIYQGERYEKQAIFHEKIDRMFYLPRRVIYYLHNRIRIMKRK